MCFVYFCEVKKCILKLCLVNLVCIFIKIFEFFGIEKSIFCRKFANTLWFTITELV